MNRPDAFDDLARQKLEERAFRFDEGHWHDMQRLLDGERRRKRVALFWGIGTGLLLLTAGTALFLGSRSGQEKVAELPANAPTAQAPAATDPEQRTATAPAYQVTSKAPDAVAATAATSNPAVNAVEPATSNAPQAATPPKGSAYQATPEDRPGREPRSTGSQRAKPSTGVPDIEPAMGRAPSKPTVANAASSGTGIPAGTGVAPGVAAGDDDPKGPMMEPQAVANAPQATHPTPAPTDTTKGPSLPPSALPQEPGSPLAADPSTPQDTANAPTATSTTPPIVPPASPWELTVWGGGQRTSTRYSGAELPWAGTIADANAPAFGAEVMHMGRHIGVGAGLHYVTYAERYQQPELFTRITDIEPVYTMISVDTTLLVVTGTVLQNGQVFYTTEQVDTSVYVLDVGSDTTVIDIRTQEGVDRVNQVSYLELPLFVDGHLDAGRWRFGLRGGPTVGLLTGRKGSLPVTDPSGMISLEDQPFREYMFGWTMRGYVRYRLGDRWWLGVEPMMRGQLMNAYSTGSLERRSTGMGIGFSVSWRLP